MTFTDPMLQDPKCVLQERLEIEMKELQGPLAEASKENRKFSRDVRDIVQAGDIAHARKLCEEQVRALPAGTRTLAGFWMCFLYVSEK